MSDVSRGNARHLLSALATSGNKVTDPDREKLQPSFLVYMGLLMSGGGLLWGSISLYFGL